MLIPGGMMMPNKEKRDSEARAKFELDVDRYVNEGLHGGTVNPRSGGRIEEDVPQEKQSKRS